MLLAPSGPVILIPLDFMASTCEVKLF